MITVMIVIAEIAVAEILVVAIWAANKMR